MSQESIRHSARAVTLRASAIGAFATLWLQAPAVLAQEPLTLADFKPRSMLKVPAHEVERAAFPAVDVHNHVNDARARDARVPVPELLAMLDRLNVKRLVILTGRWGDRLQDVVDRLAKPHPDRFTVFTEPDWSRVNEPGFGEAMAAQIRDAYARGARGLKVLKELGLNVKDHDGKLLAIDDPRLDPMWAECGRLGIPVAIHTADPDAFFEPRDGTNERWEELGRRPLDLLLERGHVRRRDLEPDARRNGQRGRDHVEHVHGGPELAPQVERRTKHGLGFLGEVVRTEDSIEHRRLLSPPLSESNRRARL